MAYPRNERGVISISAAKNVTKTPLESRRSPKLRDINELAGQSNNAEGLVKGRLLSSLNAGFPVELNSPETALKRPQSQNAQKLRRTRAMRPTQDIGQFRIQFSQRTLARILHGKSVGRVADMSATGFPVTA